MAVLHRCLEGSLMTWLLLVSLMCLVLFTTWAAYINVADGRQDQVSG